MVPWYHKRARELAELRDRPDWQPARKSRRLRAAFEEVGRRVRRARRRNSPSAWSNSSLCAQARQDRSRASKRRGGGAARCGARERRAALALTAERHTPSTQLVEAVLACMQLLIDKTPDLAAAKKLVRRRRPRAPAARPRDLARAARGDDQADEVRVRAGGARAAGGAAGRAARGPRGGGGAAGVGARRARARRRGRGGGALRDGAERHRDAGEARLAVPPPVAGGDGRPTRTSCRGCSSAAASPSTGATTAGGRRSSPPSGRLSSAACRS